MMKNELLEFFEDLLPAFGRERIMCEATAFAEHLEDAPRDTVMADAHLLIDQTLVEDKLVAIYDQRHLLSRPKRKWYTPESRSTKKVGICVHHTAVKGGFGVHKPTAVIFEDREQKRMRAGHFVDWDNLLKTFSPYPYEAAIHSQLSELSRMYALGRMHALGARYRGQRIGGAHGQGQPYHAITGPNSTLYLNLPFDWVTWHGNGANSQYLGYAWDGNSLKETPPADEIIEDLCTLAEIMKSEDHRCDELTVHSSWTNKPHDPGAEFIDTVLIPAAEKIGATINLEFSKGEGRPIFGILEVGS